MTTTYSRTGIALLAAGLALVAAAGSCGGDKLSMRPPYLAASTDVVDFGDIAVGRDSQRTLYLINKGEQELTVEDPEGDTLGGIFAVLLTQQKVAPSQDLVVRITFAPTDVGDYETTMVFPNDSINEGRFEVTLRGRGVSSNPCYGVVCQTPPSPCFQGVGECVEGACVYPINDTVGCDDDNPCTLEDTCSLGTCSGQVKRCEAPPPDGCISGTTLRRYEAIGTCSRDSGDCEYSYLDISCENGCADGLCTGYPCAGGCDDGNPCTIDDCQGGCVHLPNDGGGCAASSSKCPVGVCAGTQCFSRSGELCTATIDRDLCADAEIAGVCTAAGSCEVEEVPPDYQCPECPGICLQCYGVKLCIPF